MSYLDKITFEESTLLEGQQAEEYKAKKKQAENDSKEKDP